MNRLREEIIAFFFARASRPTGRPGTITLLMAVFFFSAVALTIPAGLWADRILGLAFPAAMPKRLLGLPFLAVGLIFWGWSVGLFLRAKGTPVPVSPPPMLIVNGPYAYTRNPMITGMLLTLIGLGFLAGSPSLAFIFAPLLGTILFLEIALIEEPELERRLGDAYRHYRRRVPRLLPRIMPYRERGDRRKSHPLIRWTYFALWRPSFGRRMTIAFTLFGLIVGYAVYAIVTTHMTRDFIRLSATVVETALTHMIPGDEDEFYALVNKPAAGPILKVKAFFRTYTSRTFHIRNYHVYLRDKEDRRWHLAYVDHDNILRLRILDDPALEATLDRVYNSPERTHLPWFLGTSDTFNITTNVTLPEDRDAYILSLDIDRRGFLAFIQSNLWLGGAFGLSLLIFSLLLGYTFRLRLMRPIETLSHGAASMARGDFNQTFTVADRDEIGTLAAALNAAASRVREDIREREELLYGTLAALTRTVDAKSPWTAGHSERVTALAERLGRAMGLDNAALKDLKISGILHDIGKIGVPGAILNKPSRLTPEETEAFRAHPALGAAIIADIPAYRNVMPAIRHHHEHWDGSGYPDRLAGEAIPLTARILAVADVYDALAEDRPYRKRMSRSDVLTYFHDEAERQFDPAVVAVLETATRPSETAPTAAP